MERIGFVTDSTAYLDPAFIDKHQIEVASLIVNFEGESIPEVDLYGEFDQFEAQWNLPIGRVQLDARDG